MQKHMAALVSGLAGRFEQYLAASESFWRSLPAGAREIVGFLPVDIGDRIGPRTIAQAVGLGQTARRIGADVVHSHGYKAAVRGVFAARIASAKSVITIHNAFPYGALRAAAYTLRLITRLSDRIIAVSPSMAESLAARGVEEKKIRVVPNGVNVNDYGRKSMESARAGLDIDPAARMILCAARLTRIKGVECLINSAGIIAAREPQARIFIAGDGPDRIRLEELAQRMAPGIVTFLGHRSDVPDLLAAANVVAIPSLAEGQGLILLEAMASAKPVVASRVAGLADVLRDGETGMLAPPGDTKALAEAVMKLLHEPDLAAAYGHRARRLIEREFAVEQMIARTEEVYLCVC
ncbi:MAG: glycosyltransferase family 4 protein [Armatimonadetes bacterium]|nr:glycosyltransferase family 4 protein [Armatimonadota bacterium]